MLVFLNIFQPKPQTLNDCTSLVGRRMGDSTLHNLDWFMFCTNERRLDSEHCSRTSYVMADHMSQDETRNTIFTNIHFHRH